MIKSIQEAWRDGDALNRSTRSGKEKSDQIKRSMVACPKCGRKNGVKISYDSKSPYEKCRYADCDYFKRF